LGYFGEAYKSSEDGQVRLTCGNCDNCLQPPDIWDGTEAARMLLSTIYRVKQQSGMSFGAGHMMDILRGKATEKVSQYGHDKLSTFGIGAHFTEVQLRGVLRQLIALGALGVDAQAFNTLYLTEASRAVLKGEVTVRLRASVSTSIDRKAKRTVSGASKPAPIALDDEGQKRYEALKAWRAEVARSHNLPAYVIFHDTTLAAIAQAEPHDLEALQGIAGIGAKKLEAYGDEVLRVVGLPA
jgi:ATP-dependent DNA helicase RecQ